MGDGRWAMGAMAASYLARHPSASNQSTFTTCRVPAQNEPARPPTEVCQGPHASVTVNGTVEPRLRFCTVTVNWTVAGLPVGANANPRVWLAGPPATETEALVMAWGAPK